MKKQKILSTLEEIKVFSNPYRLQILNTIKKLNKPATVKQIAEKMKETPAKVHYHVKKLEKVDILHIVDTKEINGIIAKYYNLTAENYTLDHNETDPEIKKLILNEFQRTISSIYDKSKKTILKEIKSEDPNIEKENKIEDIFSSEIYLSNKDANELKKIIQKYVEKNENNPDKENLNKYHLFTVFFSMDN
ncbi:MAG: helix-turn-helix transcriptional regulator [Firmicutes bacterium]|nr:helix-turn-helix transcriptional regulator [Bacillota bacterium]